MKEHDIQGLIMDYLARAGILAIETDCMSGLQYFSHKDPRRYGFINHHKKMGYKKGQPDCILFMDNGDVICAEIKQPNKYQSKEQKQFEADLIDRGHTYVVWKSIDDCIDYIKEQTS